MVVNTSVWLNGGEQLSSDLYIAITISELVSLILVVRGWYSKWSLWEGLFLSAILLVPFVGPLFYFFIEDDKPLPASNLHGNDLGYGEYTRIWIAMRPLWKKFMKTKKSLWRRGNLKKMRMIEV